MVNRSKAKGTRFESSVRALLELLGLPDARRRVLAGGADVGDVSCRVGDDSLVLECKATRELNLAGAVDEARREAVAGGDRFWAAVVKRRGRPTPGAYLVTDAEHGLGWLAELHGLREEAARLRADRDRLAQRVQDLGRAGSRSPAVRGGRRFVDVPLPGVDAGGAGG